MKALFFHRNSISYGNVTWSPPIPMRGGKFPQPHPCAANPKPTVFGRGDQPESTDPLGQLRARGYLASCFPEGDGISFDPPAGHSDVQAMADFVECFGFELTRGDHD